MRATVEEDGNERQDREALLRQGEGAAKKGQLPVNIPDIQNLIDPSDYCALTVYTIFPPFSSIITWVSFCGGV